LYGTNDVRKLSNTRGFDQNTVRMVLIQHFLKRLSKIANQGAANATAVHFGHFNSRILHKATINTDLTEFIFNQNKLFANVSLV